MRATLLLECANWFGTFARPPSHATHARQNELLYSTEI